MKKMAMILLLLAVATGINKAAAQAEKLHGAAKHHKAEEGGHHKAKHAVTHQPPPAVMPAPAVVKHTPVKKVKPIARPALPKPIRPAVAAKPKVVHHAHHVAAHKAHAPKEQAPPAPVQPTVNYVAPAPPPAPVVTAAPTKKPQEEEQEGKAFLGVFSSDCEQGAFVDGVVPGSPAEEAGLRRGDVITGMDGKRIENREELLDALDSHDAGDKVKIGYSHGGDSNTEEIELGNSENLERTEPCCHGRHFVHGRWRW